MEHYLSIREWRKWWQHSWWCHKPSRILAAGSNFTSLPVRKHTPVDCDAILYWVSYHALHVISSLNWHDKGNQQSPSPPRRFSEKSNITGLILLILFDLCLNLDIFSLSTTLCFGINTSMQTLESCKSFTITANPTKVTRTLCRESLLVVFTRT